MKYLTDLSKTINLPKSICFVRSTKEWLLNYGTTTAIAKNIIDIIKNNPIHKR